MFVNQRPRWLISYTGVSTIKRVPCRDQFHQHVYEQLVIEKIPKAQKDSQVISAFLHLWDLLL